MKIISYVVKCKDFYVKDNGKNYFLTALPFIATAKPKPPTKEILLFMAEDIGVGIDELEVIVREAEERKLDELEGEGINKGVNK